jgi:hypothetical protein
MCMCVCVCVCVYVCVCVCVMSKAIETIEPPLNYRISPENTHNEDFEKLYG